ncbi:MAG: ATP-binding protein [Thermodesulfobacteriota bacterium]
MDARSASVLAAVLERLNEAQSRDDALRRLADALCEQLACERVVLWQPTSSRREYVRAVPADPERGERVPAAELASDRALAHGRCVVVPRAHGGALGRLASGAFSSLLLVPLAGRGREEALAACVAESGALDESLVPVCERVAPHLATALRAWRLDEVHAKLRERRQYLAGLGTDVLTASDLESTAARLCELTRALFGTTRSALFLLEDRDLVPIAAAGPYGDRASGGSLHVPPGVEPAFDEVIETRRVLVLNEFRSSRYAATPVPLPFRPQAATVIPLADESGVLGILTASELDDPLRFGPDAADEARLLGVAATVAIRRMLLVEDLRRAGRAKVDFLATVSHELRTPLNVVLGYVQLLADSAFGTLTAEQAETVRRVEAGARSQLALVDDLLELAELERGDLRCEPAPLRLCELVDEIRQIVAPQLAGRPISFAIDLPPDVVALTDRERLKQVLLNVLGNAAKFTERGEIRLAARRAPSGIEVTVSDTGVGMEPGFVGRSTEPFVRGEGSGRGAGLGLAIVSRVLRVLGSGLAIDSRPGAGTTIRIVLPAAERDAAAPRPS